MEEQKVYVVYEYGKPFGNSNKKVAYLKERYAKQLVTTTVNDKYKQSICYDERRKFNSATSKEKLKLTKDLRKHFEIRVFTDSGEII
jgi:hypothetical protein